MSAPDRKDDNQLSTRRGAYEDAQREIRERNEAASQAAKKQRAEADRRDATARDRRYERDGVYR